MEKESSESTGPMLRERSGSPVLRGEVGIMKCPFQSSAETVLEHRWKASAVGWECRRQ